MADYMSLIERLEKATGPDRRVELDISVAVNFKGVFAEYTGWRWSTFGDEIQADHTTARGRKGIAVLDPKQFVPRWTESIDAALLLVPEGAEYSITTLYGLATVEMPLNFTDVGPQSATRKDGNVPLAICIAALKAHSLIGKKEG